jgi:hypothetical protein
MNFNNKILKKLKKNDVVIISTELDTKIRHRYLIRSVNKRDRFLLVLALEPFFSARDQREIPIISMPFSMVKKIKFGDKNDLLFLFDQIKNPHILSAIEELK